MRYFVCMNHFWRMSFVCSMCQYSLMVYQWVLTGVWKLLLYAVCASTHWWCVKAVVLYSVRHYSVCCHVYSMRQYSVVVYSIRQYSLTVHEACSLYTVCANTQWRCAKAVVVYSMRQYMLVVHKAYSSYTACASTHWRYMRTRLVRSCSPVSQRDSTPSGTRNRTSFLVFGNASYFYAAYLRYFSAFWGWILMTLWLV